MNHIRLILFLLGFCFTLPACSTTSPGGEDTPGARQRTVDALVALHDQYLVPGEYLLQEEAVNREGDFDVNEYFTVLTHVAIQPGYTLDYVYWFDGLGGAPFLYARPETQPPYTTISELIAARPGTSSDEYLDFIQTDRTEAGFFELTLLRLMGGQFYLFWHALYYDFRVVCTRQAVEAVLNEAAAMDPRTSDIREQARALNVIPVVNINPDHVRVRVVFFTKWGGFIEKTYHLSRAYPHQILNETTNVLLPYQIGIVF